MGDKVKYQEFLDRLKAKLIIPLEQIQATSALDLNIDESKLIYAAVNAQSLYLEPMIGSALYRKLQETSLPFAYQLLLDRFLNDAIINWACGEVLQTIGVSVSNGGVFRHSSTDSEVASAKDVSVLRQNYLSKADAFASRAIDFLQLNQSYYPEYRESVGDGVDASQKAAFTGGLMIEPTRGASTGKNCGLGGMVGRDDYIGGCGTSRVGSSDPAVFEAETYWGNSNEASIDIDYTTLSNQDSTVPTDVFAQPVADYFWIVSSRDINIAQVGSLIPLGVFSDSEPLSDVYVKGTKDGMTYIRIKVVDTYDQEVQFNIVVNN